jgi:hypothetical protein
MLSKLNFYDSEVEDDDEDDFSRTDILKSKHGIRHLAPVFWHLSSVF